MPATTHAQTSSAKRSAIDTIRDMTGMLKIVEVRGNGRGCDTTRKVEWSWRESDDNSVDERCRARFLSLGTPE
jgi:hypothetical protein